MNILYNNTTIKDCTGCGCCAVICPAKCISIKCDEEGFLKPIIKTEMCIDCGECINVCYKYSSDCSTYDLYKNTTVFAAISKDEKLLTSVSSGGVAPIIEKAAIANGYSVCGVVYDPDTNNCKHVIAEKESELEQFRGSKYLQSNSLPSFNSFIPGNKYCVFGTPCQIYGLDKVLRKCNIRDNYILVDLFCKGVPSKLLWNNYLSHIKTTNEMDKINSVKFRSKEISWHKFQIEIADINGKVYKNNVYDDLFFQCFVKNVCFNKPCYNCDFRHHNSAADIRLGDFWGSKYYSHEEGVSIVVLFTQKGHFIWDKISNQFWNEKNDSSIVTESQRFDKIDVYPHRADILKALKAGESIKSIYERFDIKNIKYKMKEKV